MLLVLVHALKKDLNLVVLDVDLSRQLLELGLLALYCFLLVLHFEALFVLLVLDLGDLLLNELDDLVLVFELQHRQERSQVVGAIQAALQAWALILKNLR